MQRIRMCGACRFEAFLQGHGQRRPRVFYRLQHLEQQFLLDREKLVIVGSSYVRNHFDVK